MIAPPPPADLAGARIVARALGELARSRDPLVRAWASSALRHWTGPPVPVAGGRATRSKPRKAG